MPSDLAKLLPYVVAAAMAAAGVASAQSGPNSSLGAANPTCSEGAQGCMAKDAATDKPAEIATDPSQGAPKVEVIQPTTDHSDDVPQRRANFPREQPYQ